MRYAPFWCIRKFQPSKTAAREFAQEMERIDEFCRANRISKSASSDSYYFELNGRNYRVSNHTIAASDRGMYSFTGEQVRDSYHRDSEDLICITAGKTRIIEIYNALKAGKELDGRGFVKAVK